MKKTFLFLLLFGSIYGTGTSLYNYWINQSTQVSDESEFDPLTRGLTRETAWLVRKLGYYAEMKVPERAVGPQLWVEDRPGVTVKEGCNGFKILWIYISFLLAFPGPWKMKLWFVPLSALVLQLFNAARIGALAGVFLTQDAETFGLVKKGIAVLMHGSVLIGWFLWIRYFSEGRSIRSDVRWLRMAAFGS